MTEREHIVRQGPGRRHDDYLKCPWCDMRWDYQKEKWEDHENSTKEHRDLVCTKVGKLEASIDKLVQWKYLNVIVGIAMLMFGYIYVDHFRISNNVSYNNAVIKNIDKKMDEFLLNQRHIMEVLRIDHLKDTQGGTR